MWVGEIEPRHRHRSPKGFWGTAAPWVAQQNPECLDPSVHTALNTKHCFPLEEVRVATRGTQCDNHPESSHVVDVMSTKLTFFSLPPGSFFRKMGRREAATPRWTWRRRYTRTPAYMETTVLPSVNL